MNPPMEEIDLKLDEEKESGPLLHCDFCDTDTVHKIAEALLPGLASACIDNTTGGILSSPASVAVDIRREMVDNLIQRSENFVAESVVLEGEGVELSENPFDIISDFVDDFVSTKMNFFSKVSGWLLSDRRDDRIDDLIQEMEINGFWLLNRRSSVAQTLLKNVDFKNTHHCNNSFKTPEELEEHKKLHCNYRTMSCTNEGCNSTFSAAQINNHDEVCPFKILQCEQKCSDHSIMRRDMDRHCITVCPMKLVKCPFYSVGCQSLVPHSAVDQHRSENLHSHLFYILQGFHKDASIEAVKERVEQLEKLSPGKLASLRDVRTLTISVKDLDSKLGVLNSKPYTTPTEETVASIQVQQNLEGFEEHLISSIKEEEQSTVNNL